MHTHTPSLQTLMFYGMAALQAGNLNHPILLSLRKNKIIIFPLKGNPDTGEVKVGEILTY